MLPGDPFNNSDASDSQRSPRRGKRRTLVRTAALITIDNAIDALHGHRVDIVTILALCGPLCVNELSDRILLDASLVSQELGILEVLGLVSWCPHKQFHLYRVTDLVRARQRGMRVFITIAVQSGDLVKLVRDAAPWFGE